MKKKTRRMLRQAKQFVFGTVARGQKIGPPAIHTIYPDTLLERNEWMKQFRVSTQSHREPVHFD